MDISSQYAYEGIYIQRRMISLSRSESHQVQRYKDIGFKSQAPLSLSSDIAGYEADVLAV